MTHRERLLVALDGGVPDRVPVTWELVGRCAHALTGDASWRGQCAAHRKIGSAIFNLQGIGPELHCDLPAGFSVETEDLGEDNGWHVCENRIVTPSGTLRERVKQGGIPGDPLVSKRVESFVKSVADYEVLATYLRERAEAVRPTWAASVEAQDCVRDDGLVNHWLSDSLYALANYRDDADFLIDLVDSPRVVRELLLLLHREREVALHAFNESVADVLVWDICWASTSLLSPSLVNEYVIPESAWVVENLAPGKRIVFFTTGRIRAVLPELALLRPHGIQHFDVLGDCDLAEVKRSFGDQFCIMGNFSPVVLAHGTVDDARRETRRCLAAAMAGGAYVMTTSDEVPADAKLANMRAVTYVVEKEGVYR
jgi:uroporphyrinogen decarboxylase